jgi:hypothetical protein
MMAEYIFIIIGKFIVFGGGIVAIAYGIFTWLGKKWIEQIFSERLEKLRNDINILFNRVTLIHQKEFEVLSIAWEKLHLALGLVHGLVKHVKQYPNFSVMSAGEFDHFLEEADLADFQKQELMDSGNRQKYYEDASYIRELLKVKNGIIDFHNYIIVNRIFLTKDTRQIFSEVDRVLSGASEKYDMARELRLFKDMHSVFEEIGKDLDKRIDELEKLIQKRLRFEEA